MAWRSRRSGLRLWAAIFAVYALLLHAPAMAAMGHPGGGLALTADAGEHAEHAATGHHEDDPRSANSCCVVCGAGPCAVGPVGTGGIALPLPLARSRRIRRSARRRALHATPSSWFEARGPPAPARSPL